MKIEQLSKHHQFVWNTLTNLQDGERIIGADLQARAVIQERRFLYQIVSDLRKYGYLVGSSKASGNGGYFEIRDEIDLYRTLNDLRDAAHSLLATAQRVELTFYDRETKVFPVVNEEGEEIE